MAIRDERESLSRPTVPSYYFDLRDSLKAFTEVTRKWWSEMANQYELYLSDAVLQELNSGNYPRKREIIELVSTIPLLPLTPALEQIVEFYITNYVMPKSLIGDAVHLAYASYYDIQYLLTWNCNHLANANKRKHIRVINGRLGLSTPEIVTPLELFKEEDNS
jgi:predicted nucleic acid-binding protein